MPTILLTTANDAERPLRVAAEAKDIYRLLNRVFNKSYQVKLLPEASTADLVDEMAHLEADLEVFHYCGHAHPGALQFTDRDADASKLAERLRHCPNLKLVFLNGCQTKAQAKYFLEAGVPYIIATSSSIKDEEAHWVAVQFYSYLILKNDVEAAFDKTLKDAALLDKTIDLTILRGIAGLEWEKAEGEFDWGLNVREGAKPYTLLLRPYTLQSSETVEHGKFLRSILLSLKGYSSPLNSPYQETIDVIETGGEPKDETKFTDVLKILPYPVGIRLRQIYAPDTKTKETEEQYYQELLHDYACFFETLLHYSFAMLVSQLWQHRKLINHEAVATDFVTVRQLVCSNRLTGELKDYAPAIKAAHRIMGVSGIEHPIPRIADAFNYFDSGDFQQVCRFFDQQKEFFRNKIRPTPEEAVRQCYESQQQLEKAFWHFGFIIENVLASIRNINVINFRHVEEAYASEFWTLVASQDGVVRQKRFKKPLENKSVLCFSREKFDADTPSINLFPFYIDRSAFANLSGNVVDLYQFMGYFHDDWVDRQSKKPVQRPCFYFMSLNNPDRIWRFDGQDFANATTSHIDEQVDEEKRPSQMLSVAGELNAYFEQFKNFLQLKTPQP